jgi:RecB family exonuclease
VRVERARGKSEVEAEELARAAVDERLRAVAEWIEAPGADPKGASRAELRAVVERVRAWQKSRIRSGEIEVYGAAYAQVEAFAAALAHETRDVLSQEDARQLLDRFARSEQSLASSIESAGRVAHVDHPSGLLAPCDGVFFWGFVAGTERRPPRLPWNDEELGALAAAGVSSPDPAALLGAEASIWRHAVLAARGRVVFVVPRTVKGTPAAPHPLWDEIMARLRLDEASTARVTREARATLERGSLVAIDARAPLPLPEPRASWTLHGGALETQSGEDGTSVTSLETIASCPLAWVLEHRAALRSGAISKVASGPLLNGSLAHRLVEELHAEGAFEREEAAFLARAAARFEELLRTEGATLLLPGASIERLQITRQVHQAMRALYRYLAARGYRIASVEEEITVDSAVGLLRGRLDLRLTDASGGPAILDLKWGASTYRALLAQGRAVQLSAYARAVGRAYGWERPLPPAGYFALSTGQVLASDARMAPPRVIDGPSLDTTWARAEATAAVAVESIARGVVHVSGTNRALPLLDALEIPETARDAHLATAPNAACTYCGYDAICGRKWEAFA